MNDFERIPVTVVEIDQDRCELTHGQGACPATGEPCYNTLATCQAPEAYTLGDPLTLRFSMRDRAEGFDEYVIPSVDSVRTDPTRINIGGRRGNQQPLGTRSQARVALVDHPHSDLLTDPYVDQRSYNPMERSTFWAKWLRRNPYYNNRALRIREGFAGQALGDMQTRHYVIDKIDGPDSGGTVTITAQDILRLADNDKAKAPALTNGVLTADYDEESTAAFTITGGTLAEYTAYSTNAVRIGDEVIRYSSITQLSGGNLRFNNPVRGAAGSERQSHDAEDSVQACLEYVRDEPWAVAYELLTEYGEVPAEFIDFPAWEAEGKRWLASYPITRLITEPVGITELLGELSEQCLFYIWWDERQQQVQFRAIQPAIGDVPVLSEQNAILRDSVRIKVQPDQRASEVWVNFLPRDATETREERKNFRRTLVRVDPTAASPIEYDERRVYEVFSAWLVTDTQAALLALRLLASYRDPPKTLTLDLDIKDRGIGPGDSFDIQYRGFVDEAGLCSPVRYDVVSAHESPPGERVRIEAIESIYGRDKRYGLIMENSTPSYSAATDEQRGRGFFIADNNAEMSDGSRAYQII